MNISTVVLGQGLPDVQQYISWRVGRDLKDKYPCDAAGNGISVGAREHWATLAEVSGRPWFKGLVLANNIVGLDLDNCIVWQADGTEALTEFARATIARFPGAYVERSASGRGVHILFTATCLTPGHATRRKGLAIEVYSWGRFIALGQYWHGSVTVDHTAALVQAMGEWGLRMESTPPVELEAGRNPEWLGPEDDEALLAWGLANLNKPRSAGEILDTKPTFAQLWTLDTAAITRYAPQPGRRDGRTYDATIVDAMMMSELSYLTGQDRPRMARLFMRWAGYRPHAHEEAGGYRLVRALNMGCGHKRAIRVAAPPPAVVGAEGPAQGQVAGGELGELVFHLPSQKAYHRPTGEYWPIGSVDARIARVSSGVDTGGIPKSIKASQWLAQNAAMHQITWAPGWPEIIQDHLSLNGVLIHYPGKCILNTYKPATPVRPRGISIQPWHDHVVTLYPNDAERIFDWMAFVAQNEGIKINHALVLGGGQGIGKDDVVLAPLIRAVGEWNVSESKPKTIVEDKNNAYLRCRLLRISEAKDAKSEEKFLFYEEGKTIITAPPNYHSIQDKFIPRHQIPNVNNTAITTNYRSGGLYVPQEDRRYYIVFSDVVRTEFSDAYWVALSAWMKTPENVEECAAWLMARDVRHFDPKAPPPRTPAFYEMAEGGQSGETNALADLISGMEVFTIRQLAGAAQFENGGDHELYEWLMSKKNGVRINRALNDLGWVKVKNPHERRGRWLINGIQTAIYVPQHVSMVVKLQLAQKLGS